MRLASLHHQHAAPRLGQRDSGGQAVGTGADDDCIVATHSNKASNSATALTHSALLASLGMRQSPRGESATEPTLGPSGMDDRLNCWLKKRR